MGITVPRGSRNGERPRFHPGGQLRGRRLEEHRHHGRPPRLRVLFACRSPCRSCGAETTQPRACGPRRRARSPAHALRAEIDAHPGRLGQRRGSPGPCGPPLGGRRCARLRGSRRGARRRTPGGSHPAAKTPLGATSASASHGGKGRVVGPEAAGSGGEQLRPLRAHLGTVDAPRGHAGDVGDAPARAVRSLSLRRRGARAPRAMLRMLRGNRGWRVRVPAGWRARGFCRVCSNGMPQ